MPAGARLRVLCTCLPGLGHFLPMRPLARALADAGHEVSFATAAEFLPEVERRGFPAFPAGISLPEQMRRAAERYPERHALPHGKERFETFVPRMLAGVAAPARAEDLVALVRELAPDVIVHDETDFGAPVAAAIAGVPYADHSVAIFRPLRAARIACEELAPLWQRHGVDLGEYGGLFRYIYLDVCPPSLQSPEAEQIDVAHPMTNARVPPSGEQAPDWIAELAGAPTVYVSLGTLFNQDPGVFAAILEGLRQEPLNVVVTIGSDQDPAALGPQPPNVHVAGFIPQSLLLPHCDVVVNQGGTAIFEILAHGLPLLVLPRGANQFNNAEALVGSGAALALMPAEVEPGAVRAAIRALIDEPRFAERARALAAEIEQMPGPEHGVALIERLARERRPLRRTAVAR
jgi:UDP:flavonoid glycosyltransferase YjiC (YdhE family)